MVLALTQPLEFVFGQSVAAGVAGDLCLRKGQCGGERAYQGNEQPPGHGAGAMTGKTQQDREQGQWVSSSQRMVGLERTENTPPVVAGCAHHSPAATGIAGVATQP